MKKNILVTTGQKTVSRTSWTSSLLLKQMWQHRIFYLFILPAFMALIIFSYRPYMWLTMAFQDFQITKGAAGSPYIGFQNFLDVFQTPTFFRAVRNTLGINLLGFVLGFPAPIICALLINELRHEGLKKRVQTLTYLPHFLSWVIVAGLFYIILDEDMGIINMIISLFGRERIPFLRTANYFWVMIVSITIWKEVGWGSIIYLASLTNIDPTLYEAATVDGASKWKQVLHVTLPGIMPTIAIMLILTAGKIATGGGIIPGFDAILNMSNPMINEQAETLKVFSYTQGILYYRYSFAAAIGIIESLVAFFFVFGSNTLAKKIKGYGLF